MNLEIYIKGYGFLSFTKNISNKYSQKLHDSAKKSTTDVIKTASKTAIQKTPEETGYLTGNKIADKIASASKSSKKLHSQNKLDKTDIPKEKYVSPEKNNKLLMN